jgi:urea transport system ATP-binding protein
MLVVEHLDVSYGSTQVLFDVSLQMPEGGLLCVMGRNGVGKTTLLKTVAGLLKPSSGRIRWNEADLSGVPPYERVRLGIAYVSQGHEAFPELTVRENLQVVIEATRQPAKTLQEVLGLFPRLSRILDRPAGVLSGGQKQQLALARALSTSPRLLILDEPTEGLQPSIVQEIEEFITDLHRERHLSILLAEQYIDYAIRVAERYVVLDAGAVVTAGYTSALADNDTVSQLVAF